MGPRLTILIVVCHAARGCLTQRSPHLPPLARQFHVWGQILAEIRRTMVSGSGRYRQPLRRERLRDRC